MVPQQGVALPRWEDLCYFHQPSQQHHAPSIAELRANPPRLLQLAHLYVRYSGMGYRYTKFVSSSWGEVVDLVHDQALRNRDLPRWGSLSRPLLGRAHHTVAHAQQPCTAETTVRRVERARELCDRHDPILVVGDDDCVGVELAKAGFTQVTSLDIDPAVCRVARTLAAQEGVELRVAEHDLSRPPARELIAPYKLVFLDPMYSVDAVRMFLEGAMALITEPAEAKFFLCVHLMSLFRSGITDLEALFAEKGLIVDRFDQAFNHYPVPGGTRFAVSLVNRVLMRTEAMAAGDKIIRYFLSDAILLRSESHS